MTKQVNGTPQRWLADACRHSISARPRVAGAVLPHCDDLALGDSDARRDREWLRSVDVDGRGRRDDDGVLVDPLDRHWEGGVALGVPLP